MFVLCDGVETRRQWAGIMVDVKVGTDSVVIRRVVQNSGVPSPLLLQQRPFIHKAINFKTKLLFVRDSASVSVNMVLNLTLYTRCYLFGYLFWITGDGAVHVLLFCKWGTPASVTMSTLSKL